MRYPVRRKRRAARVSSRSINLACRFAMVKKPIDVNVADPTSRAGVAPDFAAELKRKTLGDSRARTHRAAGSAIARLRPGR